VLGTLLAAIRYESRAMTVHRSAAGSPVFREQTCHRTIRRRAALEKNSKKVLRKEPAIQRSGS